MLYLGLTIYIFALVGALVGYWGNLRVLSSMPPLSLSRRHYLRKFATHHISVNPCLFKPFICDV